MIPEAFKQYPQFINHDSNKIPVDTQGTIDPHDTTNHLTYQEALDRAALYGLGVGFVFTASDPFFFLDIDHALVNGQWSELATTLCQYFPGCYIEVSMSGDGLHIFGTYTIHPEHSCKNIANGLEFYTESRYVALTGTSAQGNAATPIDSSLAWLIGNYFTPGPVAATAEWTTEPAAEWNGLTDDTALIEKMLNSKQSAAAVFGNNATIQDLWNCNTESLSIAYPHETNEFDRSSADAALVQRLAFWTGKDCERIERLFGLSGLLRDKWVNREDYRRRTILNACARCDKVYGQGVDAPPPVGTVGDGSPNGTMEHSEITKRDGFQFMPHSNQSEFFKGCVYVSDVDKVLIPNGRMLNQSQFKSFYGGYLFALDDIGDKTTPDAWKAFTVSQVLDFPKVDHTCFRPLLSPGTICTDDVGHTEVNTYIPAVTASTQGDISPFIQHITRLIPDPSDRAILLAYMAACVQHIGVKFQWCPLIQGVQGNGKSLLARCLKRAIGERYCHTPNPKDIDNRFNAWIEGKLLIVIEEIAVSGKWELMDVLKPMITQRTLEIQGKGVDQRIGSVCANFFMNSNHKDAVVKTADDRRHCIFYTAQQEHGDLQRDGMAGDYFPQLYNWLNSGGYAVVTNYLQSYSIPVALNPALDCQRAPHTTSTPEAITFSFGTAEQIILEAIGEDQPGFMGGWISSIAVGKLLMKHRVNKSQKHRKDMMKALGYIYHPGLRDGRCTTKNMIDNGKPRLYVRQDSIQCNIVEPLQVVAAYVRAQGLSDAGVVQQIAGAVTQ